MDLAKKEKLVVEAQEIAPRREKEYEGVPKKCQLEIFDSVDEAGV
jgi:hypothetical protein